MHSLRLRSHLLGTLCLLAVAVPSWADPVRTSTLGWAISGIVSEVARSGDIAYVGGSFGMLAPSENLVFNFATFSASSATPVLPRLDVNGRVRTVVALGSGGGWILGGDFTQVNGADHQRLVRLRADGTVDPTFTASASGTVRALAVSGTALFLGGSFRTVNGVSRDRVARIELATGVLDATFSPTVGDNTDLPVNAVLVRGDRVIVGGAFAMVNGAPRENLVALDANNGTVVAGFTATADGPVAALAPAGAELVAAGAFTNIGGLARRGIARLDATSGAAIAAFDAGSDGDVKSIAVGGGAVFAAGSFLQIGGASRRHVARLDQTSGAASAWDPNPDHPVEQIALRGTTLIAVGDFMVIGGEERFRIAALDTTRATGMTLSWNPSLDQPADMVHVDAAGYVFAGGSFNYYGAVLRQNIAAIDLATGGLLNFNPGADGWVRALAIHGSTLFVGGDFLGIGGATRHHIAALNGVTGAVLPWAANADQRVHGISVSNDVVYFVGEFQHVNGATARLRAAAVGVDGVLRAWDPSASDTIETLAVAGNRVYLGGEFASVGGTTRAHLAAVDATTGAVVTSFAPAVSGTSIYRLNVSGSTLFVGGRFSMVNGSTRNNAAAMVAAPGAMNDGELLGWNPDLDAEVYDLEVLGADVYLAGGFSTVGGVSRPGIAMVDALPAGGAVRAWRPDDVAGGSISAIHASDTAVLMGGLMYDLNYLHIGAVLYPTAALPGVPVAPPSPRVRAQGNAVTIDWAPPSLGARPSSYVIEAGSAPGLANLASLPTGTTATTFSTAGVPPGTYFLRLRSQGAAGTSSATAEQALVVGAAGCTAPPRPPVAFRSTVTGGSVTLQWLAPPQSIASGYRLTIGATSGGAELGTVDLGAGTSFTSSAPSGAYFLRLVAVNACGMGAPTAELAVVVGTPVVPPIAPYGLEVVRTGNALAFTWAAPPVGSTPFTYRLEAGSAPGLMNIATVPVGASSFAVAGVPAGLYYVRVRALGAGGTSPASHELVVQVP